MQENAHSLLLILCISGSTTKAAPAIPALDAPITSSITLSSAPAVKDFEPPEPSPYDPYPGYYQLPSGEWAAHDPVVYKKFMQRLTSGVDMQAGNQTKSEAKEFAARSEDNMATFDPNEELRQGQIAEREKRKAITTTPAGAPAVPRMKVCTMSVIHIFVSRYFVGPKINWIGSISASTFYAVT